MVLDEFVYDPATGSGKLAMTATKGVFRLVGGKISKSEPVTLKTPTATIGIRGGMPATPSALTQLVDRLPDGGVWQAIAIGRNNLPMTAVGLAMGGNARTGMEDTLLLRRGVPAQSNAELVERLVSVARSLEREPATVAEVEQALALPARGE